MIAVKIPDTRKFMSDLLSRDTFDTFMLGEAQITTYTTFRIDGSWHEDYFHEGQKVSSDSAADVPSQVPQEPTWGRIRPIVFAIVRGKHSPVSFRIILKLTDHATAGVLRSSGVSISPDQVGGLFMNISYQNKEVTCTSGTSMKTFTLDKSLDHVWDDMMLKFFAAKGIEVERF